MQINYISNPEKADAVYKKTRSQYANYKIGLAQNEAKRFCSLYQ